MSTLRRRPRALQCCRSSEILRVHCARLNRHDCANLSALPVKAGLDFLVTLDLSSTMVLDPRSRLIHTAVCEITQKSESLSPDLIAQAYVDMGHVSRLLNSNNQYVDGRRGTGKTHLFSYLSEYIKANETSDTAIYIDMRNAEVESGPHLGEPRAHARALYRELLRKLALQLRQIAERELFHNDVPVSRTDWERRMAQKTDDILQRLWAAIEVGEYREDRARQQRSKDIFRGMRSVAGEVALDAGGKVPFRLRGSASNGVSKEFEKTEEGEGQYVLPYSRIGDLIQEFLDTNELGRLFILLDEWSSVPVAAQPFVAEHLKRTIFPNSRIVLKIACIPFQRSFHLTEGAEITGFERQGDIYLALDLDDELVYVRNPDNTRKNFSQLIHNHIIFHIPESEHASMPSSAEDTVRGLITEAAHERLLKYSHGNPRDYLTLFRKSYLKFYPQDIKHITSKIVDSAAKELGSEKIESIRENSRAHRLLKDVTRIVLHEKQLSAFLVKSSLMSNTNLHYLIHTRVLHVWDKSYSAPKFKGESYCILCIDFCIIADHLRAPNYRHILVLPFTAADRRANMDVRDRSEREEKLLELATPDKRQVRYCVLPDELLVNYDQTTICPACGAPIPQEHPVYVRHKLCPTCGGECPP